MTVTPQGYVPLSLSDLLILIQQANVDTFGAGVIQTPQSPLGQINGLMADILAEAEQRNADIYTSFDPAQAEGARLDTLGSIRALPRGAGQSDAAYSRVLTNQSQTRIGLADVLQSIRAVSGVTWASLKENPAQFTDASGIPPHSLAFAAIGGSDFDVAEAIYANTVPGIGLFGLTSVEVSVGGYCREVNFIRPADLEVFVDLTVRKVPAAECSIPSPQEIIAYLDAAANGEGGLLNGDTVDQDRISSLVAPIGGLAVVSALCGTDANNLTAEGVQADIQERPVIVAKNVTVRII